MGLSNWALAAINENGEGTNGVFVPEETVELEIYKNWLYVRDKDNQGETHFHGPCVMRINEGAIEYRNTTILAARGPKNGIYLVAYTGNLFGEGENAWSAILGIGCYGYGEQEQWVGIEKEDVDYLERIIDTNFDGPITSVPLDNLVQINQGDAFFAAQLGVEVPVADIGHAVEPIISRKQEEELDAPA